MTNSETTLDQLLAAIQAEANDSNLAWASTPEPLTGGFWAQMWRMRLAGEGDKLGGELVARVMPSAEVGVYETAVQAHLADSGYPTPRVRLAAGPGPELAKAWMIMDHAPGAPLLANLSGVGAIVEIPRIARALPDQLARHAATLHDLDATAMQASRGDNESLVVQLLDATRELARANLVNVAEALQRNEPPGGREVICHGDLHPFNVLSTPDGDTVLDWSAARITDPAYDIAYTRILLGHPPLDAPRPLRPVIAKAGQALARRFVRTYNRNASLPVDPAQLDWFTDLQTLRIMTEVGTWQANGELADHPGHPFIALNQALGPGLAARTGVKVAAGQESG